MPGLSWMRQLALGLLILDAVAVACTVPDYPARPSDGGTSGVSGSEGGDSGEGGSAGADGSGADGSGADGSGADGSGADGSGGDGGHGGEPPGECGDGERAPNEECDDGDVQPNDGCSADCRREIPEIAAGGHHTCVRFDDGEVACWGYNGLGQLGIGSSESRGDDPNELGANLIEAELGASVRVLELSLGFEYSCARLEGGKVKCWGDNDHGQLGTGNTLLLGVVPGELGDNLRPLDLGTGAVAKQINCGQWHCCALLESGDVKCWGENVDGQLGLGAPGSRGDDPNELGDHLDPVNLGAGHTAKAITLGDYHSCALLEDKSVKCWGDGDYGQLGIGSNLDRGTAANHMGDDLEPVDLGNGLGALQIEAGGVHTCAILEDHSLKCWGDNQLGQLGVGSDDNRRGAEPGQMGDHLLPVNLGRDRYAVRVSAGEDFTCALLDDASVKCWGQGFYGVLGQGNQEVIGRAPSEMGDGLPPLDLGHHAALDIVTGWSHACALLDNGRVKCWGDNNGGSLGNGNQLPLGDDGNEMGNELPFVPLLKK